MGDKDWQIKRDEAAGIYECDKQHPERKFDENDYKYRDFQAGADFGYAEGLAERDKKISTIEKVLNAQSSIIKEQSEHLNAVALENDKLRARLAEADKLAEALLAWITFEDEQVNKEGPYQGFKINALIVQGAAALTAWHASCGKGEKK